MCDDEVYVCVQSEQRFKILFTRGTRTSLGYNLITIKSFHESGDTVIFQKNA